MKQSNRGDDSPVAVMAVPRRQIENRSVRSTAREFLRSSVRSLVPALWCLFLVAAPALAQDADGETRVVQAQRVPYLEMLVVAAACAGAVFVVCRSSRRN